MDGALGIAPPMQPVVLRGTGTGAGFLAYTYLMARENRAVLEFAVPSVVLVAVFGTTILITKARRMRRAIPSEQVFAGGAEASGFAIIG